MASLVVVYSKDKNIEARSEHFPAETKIAQMWNVAPLDDETLETVLRMILKQLVDE